MGGLLHSVQRGEDWAVSPLLAVPNVTAHLSTAITVLLSNGPLLCAFNVATKVLKKVVPSVFGIQQITVIDIFAG